ncbi:reverse transcriptase domain-containing protein [Tanacetum coccineum]|uniref:Reverse transcriptase domain-containing protein n=1 Tax=Tanacetum coccineum TaxID=301880 RepID=A0ABQ5IW53_9ASTR
MKHCIAELPMLTAPKPKEELIMYLYAAREAVSAVLLTKRDSQQMPIYFVSRALQAPKINYNSMEKLILALVHASRRLRRPRTSIRGQVLADFVTEKPGKDSPPTGIPVKEEIPKPWTLFTDRSSCLEGSGTALILTYLEGMEFTYALRFEINASNNEAEYEALVAGLRIAEQMGIKNLEAKVDSCLVANQINGSYVAKEQSMIQYLEKAKALISSFKKFSIEQVPRSENKKADALSKITSTSFAQLTKQVLVEVLKENSIEEKEILTVVEEEGHSWMTPLLEYLTDGTLPAERKKARAIIIKSRQYAVIGGVLYQIVSDNGKQFRDNPFKDWCDKLNIRQRFASVKHPQTNELVERANHSLGEGIKARLDEGSKNWIEEVSHVLWAHRTMIKTSNGDTSFSLTYDTKAVIPVEIGMPSLRCAEVDQILNDEALLLNLDILDEKREKAAIREAKSKAKMEKILQRQGPYEVVEALRKGEYKIRNGSGDILSRTWNVKDLKKWYL